MTSYIVLGNHNEDWVEIAKVEASSSRSAIIKALTEKNGAGEYVAIPVRSWRPITAKFETKVKFGT